LDKSQFKTFATIKQQTIFTNPKSQINASDLDFDDDLSDENNPKMVTIQIRLGGATARRIKFAREGLIIVATLTLVSGVWGAGMASWMAWSEFSGASSEKDIRHHVPQPLSRDKAPGVRTPKG